MSTVAKLLGKSFSKNWVMTLIFGAVELVLSQASGTVLHAWPPMHCRIPSLLFKCQRSHVQLPSLAEAWWVSAIGSFTSLGYCAIALGLGLRYSECSIILVWYSYDSMEPGNDRYACPALQVAPAGAPLAGSQVTPMPTRSSTSWAPWATLPLPSALHWSCSRSKTRCASRPRLRKPWAGQ